MLTGKCKFERVRIGFRICTELSMTTYENPGAGLFHTMEAWRVFFASRCYFLFSLSMLYSCRSLINTICQVVDALPLVKVEVKN